MGAVPWPTLVGRRTSCLSAGCDHYTPVDAAAERATGGRPLRPQRPPNERPLEATAGGGPSSRIGGMSNSSNNGSSSSSWVVGIVPRWTTICAWLLRRADCLCTRTRRRRRFRLIKIIIVLGIVVICSTTAIAAAATSWPASVAKVKHISTRRSPLIASQISAVQHLITGRSRFFWLETDLGQRVGLQSRQFMDRSLSSHVHWNRQKSATTRPLTVFRSHGASSRLIENSQQVVFWTIWPLIAHRSTGSIELCSLFSECRNRWLLGGRWGSGANGKKHFSVQSSVLWIVSQFTPGA